MSASAGKRQVHQGRLVLASGLGLLLGLAAACGDSETSGEAEQGLGGQAGQSAMGPPAPPAPTTPMDQGTAVNPPMPAPVATAGSNAPPPDMPMDTQPGGMGPGIGGPPAGQPSGMPGGFPGSGFPGAGGGGGDGDGTGAMSGTNTPPGGPDPSAGAMADAGMPMPDPDPGTYNPCPTTGEPCRILPFGDSITEGIYAPGAWRVPLFEQAVEDGKSITFVGARSNGPRTVAGETFPQSHQATSGITIGRIHREVPSPALDEDPHIVLIHIGTNDMTFSSRTASADLEALLDDIIEGVPDALLVVAEIIPRRSGNTATEAFNETIPGIVEERAAAGAHIMAIDLYSDFEGGSMLQDSVHPNNAGNAFMADGFYAAIADFLP